MAGLLVNEQKGTTAFRISCTLPRFVLRHAALQIVCDAGIQRSVGALQDVDSPVQKPVPYLTRCFQEGLFAFLVGWQINRCSQSTGIPRQRASGRNNGNSEKL